MTDFDTIDFFTDQSLVDDPHPYFDHLREKSPVFRLPLHNVVAVTGYDEALEVWRDHGTFSACNSVTGPFPGLPVRPQGDDITELIAKHRHQLPMSEYLATHDQPVHTAERGLLMKLLTPKRMQENEAFMWRLADRQIDRIIGKPAFEVLGDFAKPFALLVIADLLGVPEEDHRALCSQLGTTHPEPAVGEERALSLDPLAFLFETFTSYIEDRRRAPRQDVLTELATATYPDGTTPEVPVVVRTATFLFAAGHHTTAHLIMAALRVIGDRPEVQKVLRNEPERIPNFLEEVLRMEGPVKSVSRMARVSTSLGGVEIRAGTTVTIFPHAANRDPRRFDAPNEFRHDRPNAREQLSFGRGIHSCPGGPLARIEARIALERLLDRTADIRISEAEHGPAGARRYAYEPTYVLRGAKSLHLELTPT
jgi:cytochrome P450